MELIEGITLKQYMQKKGNKLNWREALHFITQIVKALGHAHSRGIIHRDIKPHNIMILRDGSVKVADFGIARLTSAGHSTLTQETLGSVHYISPEQARGSHIDSRSDLYSAGVVLYEMITGRLPFEGDSPVAVAIQHINSIPLSPRELNEEIPEALETITMKAMAPSLDKRYISADAMLADLEEFRKNPNIDFDYELPVVEDEADGVEKTRKVPVSAIPKSIRDQVPGKRRDDTGARKIVDEDEEYEDYSDLNDDEDFEGEDDEEYYEVECPSCGEKICFTDDIEIEELVCPACGELVGDTDLVGCGGDCEDCEGCE
jgi:serine/threonine-protein kinase